ncbi:armadillo-like helical domain-containing protein 4 isoform X1 [Pantherophis guttatus]|uniref:Armadillo-like helical domain-containing protein 4 isoform X1 n=1 Tax=Pantherophis guttatus TaxID=94885 RepID=A0A6P9D0S9_PANGU|nr:armadillo-like helical domain-containing protein 4 isoform X1 [Pantherophis guttatus]
MTEIICSAHFHANFSLNMSSVRGYHTFLAFCLILLNFGSLQCLVLRQGDERHERQLHLASPAGNSLADTNASNPEGNFSSSMNIASASASESLYGASVEPSKRSLNRATTVKTTLPTILHVHNPSEHSDTDAFASTGLKIAAESERKISLNGPNEKPDKNGTQEALIATVVTIPDLLVEDDTLSSAKETVEGGGGEGKLDGDQFTLGSLEESAHVDPSDNPQVVIPKVIISFPATPTSSNLFKNPFLPTSPPVDLTKGSDGNSFPTIWMGTDAATEPRSLPADASLNLEGEISENQGPLKGILSPTTMATAGLLLSDEWDDTKLEPSSQAKAMHPLKINQPQIAQPTGQENDDVKKDPSPRLLATTAKGSKDNQNGSGQIPMQVEESANTSLNLAHTIDPSEKVGSQSESPGENVDPTVIIRSRLFPETITTTDATKSDVFQTLRHQLRGTATAFPGTATVPSPGLPTQKTTESQNVMEKEIELATQISTVSSTAQLLRILETVAPTGSPPSTHLPVKMVAVKEPVTLLENEEIISVTYIPATVADLRVPAEMTLPSLASSTRQTTVLAAHRITTASTYGLERLESEEEEEEEEEEEDEEEEEEEEDMDEDEEENDVDREPSLIDENLDDADLSSFTVPGETSQEPLEGLESPAGELSGISYHVPNAIEWEQQNQGLVRSWMEKLKDKAGYMSGMLVPVGVGIAGALFILGALYSIKIMNRRRRNGFKRHKRKQREFNSMQDRVMLLADSSEDEF